MPKSTIEAIESFLQRQPAATLAAVLLELAEEHEAVQRRLARLQLADRPDKLASAFKKTLAGWRRSKRFYDYRESRAFGRERPEDALVWGATQRSTEGPVIT